jgi:hypothetical protein
VKHRLRRITDAGERLLVRYLRRRGWIVFWLDDPVCRGECWLRLYREHVERVAREG